MIRWGWWSQWWSWWHQICENGHFWEWMITLGGNCGYWYVLGELGWRMTSLHGQCFIFLVILKGPLYVREGEAGAPKNSLHLQVALIPFFLYIRSAYYALHYTPDLTLSLSWPYTHRADPDPPKSWASICNATTPSSASITPVFLICIIYNANVSFDVDHQHQVFQCNAPSGPPVINPIQSHPST